MGKNKPLSRLTYKQSQLVEENTHLVRVVMYKEFSNLLYDLEEFQCIGDIALCRAGILYDPRNDVKFSTFAYSVIKLAILQHLQRKTLAESRFSYLYLDDSYYNDGEPDEETYHKVIPDPRINIEKKVIDRLMVEEGLSKLTPLQKLYVGLSVEGYTLTEIAKFLNVSHKSVDNGIYKMKNKLKKIRGELL